MTKTEEIRDAVQKINECFIYNKPIRYSEVRILLSLAQEYLRVEGWPEEKDFVSLPNHPVNCNCPECEAMAFYAQQYNQALHLCRLANLKEKNKNE